LILRKIIKTVATRCHILQLKCTKFDFGWGSAPEPAGGAYSIPQTPSLDLRGLLLEEGRKGIGSGREGKGEDYAGEGRVWKGMEEGAGSGGRTGAPSVEKSWLRPCLVR